MKPKDEFPQNGQWNYPPNPPETSHRYPIRDNALAINPIVDTLSLRTQFCNCPNFPPLSSLSYLHRACPFGQAATDLSPAKLLFTKVVLFDIIRHNACANTIFFSSYVLCV